MQVPYHKQKFFDGEGRNRGLRVITNERRGMILDPCWRKTSRDCNRLLGYLAIATVVLLGRSDIASAQVLAFAPGTAALNIPGPGAATYTTIAVFSTISLTGDLTVNSVVTSDGTNWLCAQPDVTNLVVSIGTGCTGVASSQLSAGQTYTGQIFLSAPTQSNGLILGVLQVTLVVGSSAGTNLVAAVNPLSFNAQSGFTAPSQSDPITFNGQPVAVNSVTTSTATGQPWLTASVGSSSVLVTANTSNLAAGAYFGAVTANTSEGSLLIQVNLQINSTASGTSALTVNPTGLSFAYQTGTAAPLQQTVSLTGSGPVTVSSSTTGLGWLFVSPTGQIAAPATLTVTVQPSGLVAGSTYTGNIQITGSASGTVNIPVSLQVSSTEVLASYPTALTFTAAPVGSAPSQNLTVFTSTGPAPYPLAYTPSSSVTSPVGGTWLQLPTVSGATTATTGTLSISVNPAGLAGGTYMGVIDLNSPTAGNSVVPIPVTLIVASGLVATPSSLAFNVPSGSGVTSQNLTIALNGQPDQITALSSSTASGETWLSATAISTGSVQVNVNTASLNLSYDSGTVLITTPDGQVSVPVSVGTPSGNSGLLAAPGSLSINVGYGAAATQGSFIVEDNGSPVAITGVSESTTTGAGWLQASISGTTGTVSVQVNPSSPSVLPAGGYSGTVFVSTSFGQLQVPVTLTVSSLSASQNPVFYLPLGSGPATASVTINLNGTPTTLTSISSSTTTGQAWLTASISGSTGGVAITVNPQVLSSAGIYTGTVSASTTAGSVSFGVTLNYGVGTTSGLVASPSSVNFNLPLVGSGAPAQNVSLFLNGVPIGNGAFTFSSGQSWLQVSNAGSGVITVGISGASFEVAGTYSTTLTVNTSAGSLIIPVTVTVQ